MIRTIIVGSLIALGALVPVAEASAATPNYREGLACTARVTAAVKAGSIDRSVAGEAINNCLKENGLPNNAPTNYTNNDSVLAQPGDTVSLAVACNPGDVVKGFNVNNGQYLKGYETGTYANGQGRFVKGTYAGDVARNVTAVIDCQH